MDLSIVPEHSFCVLRGLGQRPNKHETGGLRVNGIRLFLQSGYRFALLAAFLPPFVPPYFPLYPYYNPGGAFWPDCGKIIAEIEPVQRKDTNRFLSAIASGLFLCYTDGVYTTAERK